MSVRTLIFLAAVLCLLVVIAAVAGYYFYRSRRVSKGSWEQLMARLTFVDRDGIAQVALDLIDEHGRRRQDEDAMSLGSSQIWELVGGLKGLESLERNTAVLIDMAFYVQQWYPEAMVIAEELRLNAREIEWHVGRLKSAIQTGKLESAFASYAQPAIATYYVMTRRVLALYERVDLPMLADLQRAL